MKPSSNFQTLLQKKGEQARIKVMGAIDERADFDQARIELERARESGASELAIDLGEVSQINSIGVKKWITFLNGLPREYSLRFDRISEPIVAQANVIASLLGPAGTPVAVFMAPYLCGKCGKGHSRELRPADIRPGDDGTFVAPELPCSECGGTEAFDEFAEEYFYFLNHARVPQKAGT